MKFRFATWNVNGVTSRDKIQAQLDYLSKWNCDIVALQEVKQPYYDRILSSSQFLWSVFSLSHRPFQDGEGGNRKYGCVITSLSPKFTLVSSALVDAPVSPERALYAYVEAQNYNFTVGSFHTPNGSKWGNNKALWQHDVATWLAHQGERTIIGIDANTPRYARLDDLDAQKWWPEDSHPSVGNGARALIAENPQHRKHVLEDVWSLTRKPFEKPPVSHNRGGITGECRYDFIFVTPDIEVAEPVIYRYEDVTKAPTRLSDHALVMVELKWSGIKAATEPI